MRQALLICAAIFTFGEAIAGQVTTSKACSFYAWPAREFLGRIESGVQFQSLGFSADKGYVQITVTGWVSARSVVSGSVSAGHGPLQGADPVDLYERPFARLIGTIQLGTDCRVVGQVSSFVHIQLEGWIDGGSLVGETALAPTVLAPTVLAPTTPTARDEIRRCHALSTSNTLVVAGICLLTTAIVSFMGASRANLDVKDAQKSIDALSWLGADPSWMEHRRDDYVSFRTWYTITGVASAITGACCILGGITVRAEAKRAKPLASITANVTLESLPKIGIQLRF